MASKIDKDSLKKNLFWILLGVFVLFWVVGVVIAILPGDDTAAKAYEKSKKGIATPKSEMELVEARLKRASELHAEWLKAMKEDDR